MRASTSPELSEKGVEANFFSSVIVNDGNDGALQSSPSPPFHDAIEMHCPQLFCRQVPPAPFFCQSRCPRPPFLPHTFHSQAGDGGSARIATHLLIAGDQHFDCDLFSWAGSK